MMSSTKRFKLFRYSTLIGCFLVLLSDGLPLFWGNLSVYIRSYFRVKHDMAFSPAWTPSIFVLTWNLPALAVHFPVQRFGPRWTMLIGISLIELGLILGWLGILYPGIPFEIGFGVLYGLGACFTLTVSIHIVMDWTTENTCFVAGCLQASPGLGSIAISQAITSYINPCNEKPVKVGNLEPFFNAKDVNERVPEFLPLFIISSSATSLLGLALLRHRYEVTIEELKFDQRIVCEDTTLSRKDSEDESLNKKGVDYTPRDLLKSKTFYVLLYGVFASDVTYLVSTTYYKSFGQTRIADDHFLTFTGTTPPVFMMVSNILTGILVDRYGPQVPLMAVDILLTFSSLLFYFSPLGGKWIFYLCLQIFVAGGAAFYNAVVLAFIKVFGRYQFPIKLTMLYSISLISTLSIPYVLTEVILPLGWFALFTFSSLFTMVALVLIAIFIPHSL